MTDATILTELRAILGDGGLLTAAADRAPYESGARYDRGQAAFVARPKSTAEVSKTVATCMRHGIALIPQSGNTGVVAGSTPDASGTQAILSLDRLTAPFALDRANRSVTAGAGLRLSELNRRLAADRLFFPIDLGADPRLGGMIATNTGGSRFLRYGDVRRNTLGLTVVLADRDGTVLDLSGGLRKNNTGPDWKQLFIGTSGSFGVVTECVLNLEPLPQQTAAALLVPAAEQSVPDLLVAMEQALGSYLSAFEGMSKNAMAAALAHVPSLRNPFAGGAIPDFAILAEVSRSWPPRDGEQPLSAVLEEVLAALLDRGTLSDALVGRAEEMWALRHALSEGVRQSGKLIAFDLSFRRGDIMRFSTHMKAEMAQRFPGITICDFGHVGDGGVHFNLVVSKSDPRATDPAFEQALRDWVFQVAVEEFGGSFSAEHAIGRRNQGMYARYTEAELRRLAAQFKAATSPGPLGAVEL
ncbi:FAD-binding oxidoreductase [Dongia sp.]|uniref:FAD-binding oxidoreductase n=1 Tax=Dongia sp. TaxID=1977262 RepID=UPI003753AA8F